MAHDALAAGSVDVILSGGTSSITNAAYLLNKHRKRAHRPPRYVRSMYLDELEDAYEPDRLTAPLPTKRLGLILFATAA